MGELTMNFNSFMNHLAVRFTKRLNQPSQSSTCWIQFGGGSSNRSKNFLKVSITDQKILFFAITFVILSSITSCALAVEEQFHIDSDRLPADGGRKPDDYPDDNDGVYFDSRKHMYDGQLPDTVDSDIFPSVPVPDMSKELVDDWTRSGDYGYPDYGNFTSESDSIAELQERFYRGPVCTLVDVRNTPYYLKDLENCTIVNGFVQITFIHDTRESSFEQYSFPKLRVITEYLLIYRVYGLRSLKKLFPNLAVIRGRRVFYNYALIVFENPQLQEIGLGNLRQIERGKVRIQKNSKLCHLDTIDWERLGVDQTVIADNALSDGGYCDNRCSTNGSCVDHAGTVKEHCWGHNVCQQKKCPNECPHACEDGICVCHEECLGGCLQPNNSSACRACIHKNYNGECVKECPDDTYLENDWRCISRSACLNLTWVPHEMYFEEEGRVMKKCLFLCPPNHIDAFHEDTLEPYCKNCNSTCHKVCSEEVYTVTDVSTASKLYGCTSIPGALKMNHLVGDDVMEVLDSALSVLEEVGSLSIRRAESLVSLSFLKNLKRITGATLIDDRYSVYITNNPNLQQLFPNANTTGPDKQLQIESGMAFFHFNPKLCMKEIGLVSTMTAGQEDDKDISTITNGDRATCDMLLLTIASIEHMPMEENDLSSVRIKWEKVYVDDKRTLIGYQIFYKESKEQDAERYEGRNVCTQTGSGWGIKDALFGPKISATTDSNITEYVVAFLHNLKPYTQYALYIMTYTSSSTQKGAQSNITYFRTSPSRPSEPSELKAHAVNSSAIKVQWKRPLNPNGDMVYYIVKWRTQDADEEFAKVDTCKQVRKLSIPRNPTTPPTTTAPPKVDRTEECCSCKKTPSHKSLEDEANDNVDFENELQRKILNIIPMSNPFADLTRKRRSADLSELFNDGGNMSDYAFQDFSDDYYWPNVSEGVLVSDAHDYTGNPYKAIVVKSEELTITNLSHYTDYEIQVYACNHAVDDHSSRCSYDAMVPARTYYRHDVDDIPNESLEVTQREQKDGEMQPALRWKPPVNPNGYVKSYEIDIQEDDNPEAPPYVSEQLYCYSVYKFNKNMRTYVIPSALAAGPHRARIRAITLAGKGNWTKYVTFDIPQSAAERARGRRENSKIGIAVGAIFLIIIAIVALFLYKVKRRRDAKKIVIYSTANPEYVSLAATYTPDGYEVQLRDVELTKMIGHGNFGKVYVGFAKNVVKGQERTKVAIKKLHEKSAIHKRYEFLEEAKLMKAFNATHVVRLLGVVSQTTDPMVIMEYMAQGDLKSYLRSRRDYTEPHGEERLSPPTLHERLQMAAEIADGMAYLADIKFVHRDLAARNCLVSTEGVVKIGDFGLARDVYETDYYRKDSKGLLPIRWMAPESLRDGVFDVHSDIWSYGVVLWEIATLAEQPYQGRQHDEVTRYVIDGGYMEKPKKCPKKLYDLMLSCWQFNPEMRPKFEEILSSLTNDVSERFKEESYFFEHKRMKFDQMLKLHERATEEDVYLNCDEQYFKDDTGRIVTPLNVTPARSRCETPSGYQTPGSRYSNGSGKVGCDMLAHCDHLKRIDVSEMNGMTPCAQVPGSKHIIRPNIHHKRATGNKKTDSIMKRFSSNSATRRKHTSPSRLRKKKDGVYYSVSTGSLGSEELSDSSNSENAVTSQMLPPPETNHCDRAANYSTNYHNDRHGAGTFPRSRINAESSYDADKPYAIMNGFVNRLDSLVRHGSPFKHSNKRTNSTSEESSYVESSPLNSAHYYDANDIISTVVEVEAAPPPPSSPPPLPPVGHAT